MTLQANLLILQISRSWCLNGTEEGRLLYKFFDRCIGHNLGMVAHYGLSVTEELYSRAAVLYATPCDYSENPEECEYTCEDCGSTDPEGDSVQGATAVATPQAETVSDAA